MRRTAASLAIQKQLAETTLRSIGDAVLTTDQDGRITYLNPVAEELTGWQDGQARGHTATEVLRLRNTRHASLVDPISMCLKTGQVIGLTSGHVLCCPDGGEIPIEDSCAPIRDDEGAIVGTVLVFFDASDARRQNHLLAYHATRDELTGLVNRREFERRLEGLVHRARMGGEAHALAYIDLDQFKIINDTAGHLAGDYVLRQLTGVLRSRVRDADVLARIGGDEFGLLLEHCPLDRAAAVCEELRATTRALRLEWDQQTFETSLSIGVVAITGDTESVVEALSQADAACYLAKEKGRNRVHVYRSDDADMSRHHQELSGVNNIRQALRENRLELYTQPIQPLRPELPGRHELLLRVRSPDGAISVPGNFIAAAERFNLMADVDRWVIRTACIMLSRTPLRNQSGIFHINLSADSLADDRLPSFVLDQLRRQGISPSRICFEITETTALSDPGAALALMRTLRAEGVTFALDDFGSGFCSFSYLKTLPVDVLKLDGLLVQDVTDDPATQAIVASIVKVGQTLGTQVSAEFVEDDAMIAELRRLGADYVQGYAIGKPMPVAPHFRLVQGRGGSP